MSLVFSVVGNDASQEVLEGVVLTECVLEMAEESVASSRPRPKRMWTKGLVLGMVVQKVKVSIDSSTYPQKGKNGENLSPCLISAKNLSLVFSVVGNDVSMNE